MKPTDTTRRDQLNSDKASGGVSSPLGEVQRKSDQAGPHQEPVGGSGVDRSLERQVRCHFTLPTVRLWR